MATAKRSEDYRNYNYVELPIFHTLEVTSQAQYELIRNEELEPHDHVVSKLLAIGRCGDTSKTLYLVSWAGYPNSADSWEPEENLDGCIDSKWRYNSHIRNICLASPLDGNHSVWREVKLPRYDQEEGGQEFIRTEGFRTFLRYREEQRVSNRIAVDTLTPELDKCEEGKNLSNKRKRKGKLSASKNSSSSHDLKSRNNSLSAASKIEAGRSRKKKPKREQLEKSYGCSLCKMKYASKSSLQRHLGLKHSTKQSRCLESSGAEEPAVNEHLYKPVEPGTSSPFCNKQGSDHSNDPQEDHSIEANTAKLIEEGYSPHAAARVLEICGNVLDTSRKILEEFILKGDGSDSLAKKNPRKKTKHCKICSKQFVTNFSLERHMKTAHTSANGSLVTCSYCTGEFLNIYSLASHKASTVRENGKCVRPTVVCIRCDKTLKKSFLKDHMRRVHNE